MPQQQKPSTRPTKESGAPAEPASNMGNPSREAQQAAGDKATSPPVTPGSADAGRDGGSKART